MTENVNNRKKPTSKNQNNNNNHRLTNLKYLGSDTETDLNLYDNQSCKFSRTYPGSNSNTNNSSLQIAPNTSNTKTKLKKPTTTTSTKTKTKYDSHSEIFRSAYAKSHNEFDYPLLSCRSKYSSISNLNNNNTINPRYLSNKSNRSNPQTTSNNTKSLKNIRSSGDPYNSLSNEQLAKDYLSKNSVNKSDEKAIERIITSLEKDMKSVNKSRSSAGKSDLNIHGTSTASRAYTSEDNLDKSGVMFSSVSMSKWPNEMSKSYKDIRRLKSMTDNISSQPKQQSNNVKNPTSHENHERPTSANINNNNRKSPNTKASSNIGTLFDIIEKEATKLSIKSGYETPLTCRYGENYDGAFQQGQNQHNYLDMSSASLPKFQQQQQQRIKQQKGNKLNLEFEMLKSSQLQNGVGNSGVESATGQETPDLYQSLENPSNLNIYSELDCSQLIRGDLYRYSYQQSQPHQQRKQQQQQVTAPLIRPLVHTNRPKHVNQHRHSLDGSNNTIKAFHIKSSELLSRSKKASNSIMSFEHEAQNLPLHHSNTMSRSESDNNRMNQTQQQQQRPKAATNLRQSSNKNNIYMAESLGSFDSPTKCSLNESGSEDVNLSRLVNIKKLPVTQAKKSLAKVIKIKPTVLAQKAASSSGSTPFRAKPGLLGKKVPIKEFKCCILTDLKIGEGEFSELFQAYRFDLASPTKVAAKRLKIGPDNKNSIHILSEISVLSQIGSHPNVIEFLGVYSLNSTMYIIFEFAEQGDLKKLLDQFRKCNLNQDIAVDTKFQMKASVDIANGMEYISSLELVHKDLAARNILIDANFNFKVSDFGSCNSMSALKRPIRWMAPESLIKSQFTVSSDVWSFGVLLWEIYTYGMTPYPGMTDEEVVDRISQWYRLDKPHECPNSIYELMLSCWKEYYKARPRFSYIKGKLIEISKSIIELQTSQLINESMVQSHTIFT